MSGHLCLKWNNHSSAFLSSISTIQLQEKYCDATIACQGKYFPVHRVILSTCSEYFDEIFERMECQHPYIVFKDIEASEMHMLLNYMYQGEVEVLQEQLPILLRAAEALKIKGLAVPDELPREYIHKRRSSSQMENSPSKKRCDEKEKEVELREEVVNFNSEQDPNVILNSLPLRNSEEKEMSDSQIKEEFEENNYNRAMPNLESIPQNASREPESIQKDETEYANDNAGCSYIGSDLSSASDTIYTEQPTQMWTDFQQQVLDSFQSKPERQDDRNVTFEVPKQFSDQETDESLPHIQPTIDVKFKYKAAAYKNSKKTFHFCSFCPYKSYNKASVTLHTQFKHTKEKPFECAVCQAKFVTKLILDRHMKTHTGEKQFQCPHCPFKCIQKVHLQKHMLTHTGEKQIYQCPHCARNFSQISSLNRHLSETKCAENASIEA